MLDVGNKGLVFLLIFGAQGKAQRAFAGGNAIGPAAGFDADDGAEDNAAMALTHDFMHAADGFGDGKGGVCAVFRIGGMGLPAGKADFKPGGGAGKGAV